MKRILYAFANFTFSIFIILALVIPLSACSNDIVTENKQLKSRIIELEKEIIEKGNEIAKLKTANDMVLSINYQENICSKRFVEQQCNLLALPYEDSMVMNIISENTVVTVIDTAEVNSSIWLYISIPVYDTPSNYKGWIRENDTILYTEELKDKVQSEICVKKGENAYEIDDFRYIESTIPNITEFEERGRIIEKNGEYLKLNCPGGKIIWVKQTSVIYPSVE